MQWDGVLTEVFALADGTKRIQAVLRYLRTIARRPSDAERRRVIDLLPQTEEEIVTWAESLKAEGRAEGRAEGMRAMVRAQLVARFGTLSEDAEAKLSRATVTQLEVWGQRLVDTTLTLDAVLAN